MDNLKRQTRKLQFKNFDYDSTTPPIFYRKTQKSFLSGGKRKQISTQDTVSTLAIIQGLFKKLFVPISDLFYLIYQLCLKSKVVLICVLATLILAVSIYYDFWSYSPKLSLEGSKAFLNLTNNIEMPVLARQTPTKASVFIKKGDTLDSTLKKFGIAEKEVLKIKSDAKKGTVLVPNSGKKSASQEVSANVGLDIAIGDLLEFDLTKPDVALVIHSKKKVIAVEKKDDGNYKIEKLTVARAEMEKTIQGSITASSFKTSARASGLTDDTIDNFVDKFSTRVDFNRSLKYGDRYSVIVSSSQLEDGRALRENDILAAVISQNGKDLMAIRYVGTDGKIRYFDETGSLIGDYFLRYPAKFTRISSIFGKRFHPILKRSRPHNGVDFAAPVGTPIRATANGVIKSSGRDRSRGIYIYITHNRRYMTNYYHMSKLAKGIKTGAHVKRGQVIGYVGSTGLSTGPHLHYGFFDNGKFVNPLTIKLPVLDTAERNSKIDASYLQRVKMTLENLQENYRQVKPTKEL